MGQHMGAIILFWQSQEFGITTELTVDSDSGLVELTADSANRIGDAAYEWTTFQLRHPTKRASPSMSQFRDTTWHPASTNRHKLDNCRKQPLKTTRFFLANTEILTIFDYLKKSWLPKRALNIKTHLNHQNQPWISELDLIIRMDTDNQKQF